MRYHLHHEAVIIRSLLVSTLLILLVNNANMASALTSSDTNYRISSARDSIFEEYPYTISRIENDTDNNSSDPPVSYFQVGVATVFGGWQSLNGIVRDDTESSVARNSDGRLQLFVVGTGNGVVTKWQTAPGSSTWSAWTSLDGTVRADSDPVVAVNADGRLQLFVVGTGNGVVTKWQTAPGSSTWSAWTSLDGTVRADSDPVVAVNADGRLQLFVVGTGNGVVTKWQTAPGSSTWSAWTSLDGTVRADSDPVVAVNSDGRLQLFVVGTGNGVVTKWQTAPGSSTWSAWTLIGGTVRANSDPVVAVNSDGRLQLFVVGTGNGVVTKWQTAPGSSTWSAWTSLGGTVRANSDPVVAVNSDGRLQLFVVGTGNGVVTKWQTAPGSSTWSAWTSLDGTVRNGGDSVSTSNLDGRLEVFVVGTDNAIWHNSQTTAQGTLPSVKDPNLTVELFMDGLATPTSMAFVDSNNILVLQKGGLVRLVSGGELQPQPVLSIPVSDQSERGLLGIAITGPPNNFVFLYYTDQAPTHQVVRYTWNGHGLVNGQTILTLPATPGLNHDGGKLFIGNDGFLYVVIGDLNRNGKLQNFANGPNPDDTSVILRVDHNGNPVPSNPFFSDPSMQKVYAYGVRNSFGITFDPVNGRIWDTENGPNVFDEINPVNPGFNSGWEKVMGPIALSGVTVSDLVNFAGSHYADPVLNWREPIGITDLEFFSSMQFGPSYQNNLFVGDINNGNLYFLPLNAARNGFLLNDPGLSDLIVDNNQELESIKLGEGFNGITDILTGPDGQLYILSFIDGRIYRIVQSQ